MYQESDVKKELNSAFEKAENKEEFLKKLIKDCYNDDNIGGNIKTKEEH
jgi:phosphoribosylformimino-5-aminoimidazole carboxamide ribonucleotide (ProFAR) isomerase